MKFYFILFLFSSIFLTSCSKIRDSAGVNRKNIDEFKVIETPPLVMPPDFNLLPPEQLSDNNIDDAESELAKAILFGLDEENGDENIELSTMDDILFQTKSDEVSNSIRQEINEKFAYEKKIDSKNWDDEIEILDSIAESERLRNERLGIDVKDSKQLPTVKIKKTKKKRFFFF